MCIRDRSGHSKWATTKHSKGAQDAKRSALFSKLSRNITVAARLGGDPLPENNASRAAAVAKAKAQSMPKDKIKSAIDKAFEMCIRDRRRSGRDRPRPHRRRCGGTRRLRLSVHRDRPGYYDQY